MTTPQIIDHIHKLISEDRLISAKSEAENLGVALERVRSIIHEHLEMRKFSAKWVPECLNADQKLQRGQSSEPILEIFRCDRNYFPSRLVTMDENWLYHYDSRQSKNHYISGIAVHPDQNISSAKFRWKLSRLEFFLG